ncbi:bacteriocin-like protein [Chryseobacterium sp. OV279]|uniref:bacteriocin-like protein n=1 Tax=Chryseobacterium sp. OV279 TaxID=1500285 RepID=UPI000910A864|nr:hypothetical protein SAMN02787100_1284 [Chryseobacterium sp. OV279]
MKNFKKISREGLKSIKGGITFCKPRYMLVCEDMSICDPNIGEPCMCTCIPIV